jgi:hypothetical protein
MPISQRMRIFPAPLLLDLLRAPKVRRAMPLRSRQENNCPHKGRNQVISDMWCARGSFRGRPQGFAIQRIEESLRDGVACARSFPSRRVSPIGTTGASFGIPDAMTFLRQR